MRENTLKQRLYAGKTQYFHGSVGRLLQQSSVSYLGTMRQAAADAGK